ncbi:hypothetical protein [Kineococcus rubinsiae]|uniref:hypothetical protein n=1 Tax=Kineococcus rubinsiae TaxID=2609562 RepID=UPI001430EBF6|nr:hypothetical protein [Kineococcus rubinsiae]NIZ91571.1 hypothetical protein [Kineococcus rubinsiae]
MPTTTSAPGPVLTYRCDGCARLISDLAGDLHVAYAEVHAHRHGSRSEPARWAAHHRRCNPLPKAAGYRFPIEAARTSTALLVWTLVLSERDWYRHTDWPAFVRRVLEATHLLRTAATDLATLERRPRRARAEASA